MSAHDDLIESLFAVGEEKLPEALEAQIVAAGPEIVPRLEALLDDETLMREDGRGDGWVPLFALKLLGKMQATTSIPRIIQLLAGSDPLDYSWSYAIKALDNMGAPALEPLLKAYALTDNDDDVDAHVAMASALAEIHVRDERRFQLLLERCREPEDTLVVDIIGLAEYGDARALPTLTGLLDRTFSSGDDHIDLDRDEIIEACQAIEELGGTLTPAQQTLRDGARRIRHSGAAHVPVRKEVKPGRNEPCWCGSGAKYKRCHLAADEAKRHA